MEFEFKERIKILRKHLNLTQEEFGKKIGVSKTSAGNYETGVALPYFETIQKILEFSRVNAEWLILGEGEMFTEKNSKNLSDHEIIRQRFPHLKGPSLERAVKIFKLLG